MLKYLTFNGFRCFHRTYRIPLRPITLLVGENSTGKSAFLAMVRLAWDVCTGASPINFNEEPFGLGAYDQIASYRGGKFGRAKKFSLGGEITLDPTKDNPNPNTLKVSGTFVMSEGQPFLKQWIFASSGLTVTVNFAPDTPATITIQSPEGTAVIKEFRLPRSFTIPLLFSFLGFSLVDKKFLNGGLEVSGVLPSKETIQRLERLYYEFGAMVGARPYSFAPIRTRPQRTYELLKDVPKPEGSHVPLLLAKISGSDPKRWQELVDSLDSFGKVSGLFSSVSVRRLGSKASDPFQLYIKISGPAANLVDVGYGISQALPIVVDSLNEPSGATFLMQQPEVHLHPKAQAELASFLMALAKNDEKSFIIETHSDHMIDRIKLDIRDGKGVSPEDIIILYLERDGANISIYPIEVDRLGNLVNAPSSYRSFFLEEERRFFMVDSVVRDS